MSLLARVIRVDDAPESTLFTAFVSSTTRDTPWFNYNILVAGGREIWESSQAPVGEVSPQCGHTSFDCRVNEQDRPE